MKQPTAFDRARAGIKLAAAIEEAMHAVAQTDQVATVDANGNVDIDKQSVREHVWEAGVVCKAYDKAFDMLWEDIEDAAIHAHRAKWAEYRERKRSQMLENAAVTAGMQTTDLPI